MGAGLVTTQTVTHALVDGLLVLAVLHVDEVDNDEPADIAETELASNLIGSLEVGLKDGFVHVLAPFVSAGVHINGDHCLGLVDHKIAAAWQPNLTQEGVIDLGLDGKIIENRLLAAVVVDRFFGALGDLAHQILHPLGRLQIIDMNGVNTLGEEVTNRAVDEVGLQNQGAGGWLLGHSLLHFAPLVEEEAEIPDKEPGLLPLARSTDNDAHPLRQGKLGKDLPQTGALLWILDLAGDAALVVKGHQHHVATRHRDVGGDPGTLGADGTLGHLDHDLTADGVNIGNVFGRDLLLFLGVVTAGSLDGLDAAIKGGRNRIPEMQEGVFLEADVDEHGFEAVFDVADFSLEDATNDIALAVALDGVFLQLAILKEGNTLFEFLATDDQLNAGAGFLDAKQALNCFNDAHGIWYLGVWREGFLGLRVIG